MGLPETSEGTSCENRAFRARKKNFMFVGEKGDHVRLMVRLGPSADKAAGLADPRVEVGKHGWVTINCAATDAPDIDLLLQWVIESYRLLAPKTLVRELDER
jgi:predicted DNA-binding protein (MmcQ/YjbR family)